MPEDTASSIETLDLRFRVQPPKRASWLPGGVVIWFLIGVGIGSCLWLYGRKELAKRLQQQVASSSTSGSLFAIEALESLDPKRIDHLVTGLKHNDARVAKVAFERIGLHIDSWKELEVVQQHAAMRTLAEQLRTVPASIQENNLPYLRGLAAKIYAIAMSQNDPNLKPVITICERLVALERLDDPTLVREIAAESLTGNKSYFPPAPLSTVGLVSRPSTSTPTSAANIPNAQPAASLYLVPGTTRPRSLDLAATRNLSDSAVSANLSDDAPPKHVPSLDTNTPVVVRTPASIASTPVAQMKVVSNSPDFAGIEKLEIAELVKLLGNDNPNVAKAAAIALRHKGMDDGKIQLASELAVGSAQHRLRIIQSLAQSNLDPRPWLIWMAEDGEPEVRRMAISILIPMADESVYRSLRNLQSRETDSQIKELITKSLITQR